MDILIIDDEKEVCSVISDFLKPLGYNPLSAYSADTALNIIRKKKPALVLCDIKMPGVDGIEFLKAIRAYDANLPIVMMSGAGTHERVIKTLEVGASDFIAKPFNFENLKNTVRRLAGSVTREKASLSPIEKILKQSCLDILTALASTLDAKDSYTRGHSERVRQYAVRIAEGMEVAPEEVEVIEFAAMLHDIGKIAVNDIILQKPEKLNKEEWDVVKKHPIVGSDILERLTLLHSEQPIVRHHHERFDGRGYPDGLKKEEIPLGARILAVADSFDAMTSRRPYRNAFTIEQAQQELVKNKKSQFDPKIVDVFLKGYKI
ncbi:MAG: HD domain-containing phosphohydrolase [Candidatus Omnitrophota bacterium]